MGASPWGFESPLRHSAFLSTAPSPDQLPEPTNDAEAKQRKNIKAVVAKYIPSAIKLARPAILEEGRQDARPGTPLVYGQSITDACMSWSRTAPLLDDLAAAARGRRGRSSK
mgnify:CR=1 FL=1